ncbi:hypothetical protein D1872_329370 [compost metagenome]
MGTPEQVKERLIRIAEQYQTDELLIVTSVHDFESRIRSYRLLAEAFELPSDR